MVGVVKERERPIQKNMNVFLLDLLQPIARATAAHSRSLEKGVFGEWWGASAMARSTCYGLP